MLILFSSFLFLFLSFFFSILLLFFENIGPGIKKNQLLLMYFPNFMSGSSQLAILSGHFTHDS